MMLAPPCVAVIDIGSNSIKALVAHRDEDGRLRALEQRTLDTRISTGISRENPHLSDAGIAGGVAAVVELAALVRTHHPRETIVVATSAVRDAANGADFGAQVLDATNLPLRILSGDDEARYIGRGMLCDPALTNWTNFHVFDLGGGSLECLTFVDRELVHECSLPLGCVRLAERFLSDPSSALSPDDDETIRRHVATALRDAAVPFSPTARAVFAGGTMTTVRSILAEAKGITLDRTSPRITVELLTAVHQKLSRLALAERRNVPGLPARRADVMPAALSTVLALAEVAGFREFQHSFYNLRWGIADSLLPT